MFKNSFKQKFWITNKISEKWKNFRIKFLIENKISFLVYLFIYFLIFI